MSYIFQEKKPQHSGTKELERVYSRKHLGNPDAEIVQVTIERLEAVLKALSANGVDREAFYFSTSDFEEIVRAHSLNQLADSARTILGRLPRNAVLLTGPFRNGDTKKRVETYQLAAVRIQRIGIRGTPVLNLLPFLRKIWELEFTNPIPDDELVNVFYKPLMEERGITQIVMLPDWETSLVSVRLREIAEERKILVRYLRNDFADLPEGENLFE